MSFNDPMPLERARPDRFALVGGAALTLVLHAGLVVLTVFFAARPQPDAAAPEDELIVEYTPAELLAWGEVMPEDGQLPWIANPAPAPEVIRLEFAEPIRLVGVALSGEGAETALDVPSAEAARYEVAAPDLAPGRYRVEWRGMAGDGHVMSGAFSFEVE